MNNQQKQGQDTSSVEPSQFSNRKQYLDLEAHKRPKNSKSSYSLQNNYNGCELVMHKSDKTKQEL